MGNKDCYQKRVVSGMRTTGDLHIGHYHGVLKNWIVLQKKYDCFFFAADLHAITTQYADTTYLEDNTNRMVTEWLSVGIDPKKSCIFVQSLIPEHYELHLLFSMITPINWLNRIPAYKDNVKIDNNTYGFLGYPILQSSDILLYNPEYVPIGKDQISHIEITRKISRRFNSLFGKNIAAKGFLENVGSNLSREDFKNFLSAIRRYRKKNDLSCLKICRKIIINNLEKRLNRKLHSCMNRKKILNEPKMILGKSSKLVGLDGRKMSKSYNNTINLIETSNNISNKISKMQTDPSRKKLTDHGDPNKCQVWHLHMLYTKEDEKSKIKNGCISASIGCTECKKVLSRNLDLEHAPIREKYNKIKLNNGYVNHVIKEGTIKARKIVKKNILKVKQAIGFII